MGREGKGSTMVQNKYCQQKGGRGGREGGRGGRGREGREGGKGRGEERSSYSQNL